MADLLHILPSFPTNLFTHLLPSLEKNLITTTDLITVDAVEIAKRARLPALDVRNLANAIVAALKVDLGVQKVDHGSGVEKRSNEIDQRTVLKRNGKQLVENWSMISILDERLDAVLGGGIPAGYITEITGESGAGKTQLLLTLLLSAQLPSPHGLARPVLYISTEASLSTNRLSQLLNKHPYLASLPPSEKPSLDLVLSINVPDLESQDHILRYQVPVSVRRHNVGLVVIDSVAANYRAEFEARAGGSATMARRSAELIRLGSLLRDLAREQNVAVVVANQVGDRFFSDRSKAGLTSNNVTTGKPSSSPAANQETAALPGNKPNVGLDVLSLDHQQRWFTGWGDDQAADQNLKTPSLGHTWTLQIAARIALHKESVYTRDGHEDANSGEGAVRWKRKMKVVFAPWAKSEIEGVEFIVSTGGIKSLAAEG
ncbi:MAG: hypothetical protein M1816_002555 [Peltula sp. TS41687]|nr:MAG: hypothetical protein M1816_002555 [Peltula sp. TS41687]